MMLFSMLSEAQGGKSIVLLSRHFGLSNRQMTNVIRHYLPILMRGIQKNFAQQGGLTSLLKTLDKGNYGAYYDDPEIYRDPEVRNRGLTVMGHALGSDKIQRKVLNKLYVSTGVDTDTLQLILPFVTTLALSTLYRQACIQQNPSTMSNQLAYHSKPEAPKQPQLPHQLQQPQQQAHPVQYAQSQVTQQPHIPHNLRPIPHPLLQQQQRAQPQVQQTAPASQQTMNQAQLHQQQPTYLQQAPVQQQPVVQQPMMTHPVVQPQTTQQQPATVSVTNKNQGIAPQQQPAQQQPQTVQPHNPAPALQPAPTPVHQERLPNIILQAQEAHAQKQRKINKKGRLSRMLKAPFQMSKQAQEQEAPMQQQLSHQQQVQQAQPHQEYHHAPQQQLQHSPQNLPQPQSPNRKYVSLQEKLSSQLPWYEQTG